MKNLFSAAALAATALFAPLVAQAQTTQAYAGNGETGFSGYLGKGSLTITRDKENNITFSLATHGGDLGGNAVALYIDSAPGGFASTAQFSDNGDPGHEIISGANTGSNPHINGTHTPSRSVVKFAPGFKADYALSFEGGFVGVFKLAAGKDNSLGYIMGAGQKTGPFAVTIPGAKIGVAPGGRFKFVGTLINGNGAYRSNETLGPITPDSTQPVPGFSRTMTFTGFDTFPPAAP